MTDGVVYLVEAIILRAREDYMNGKPGGHVERTIENDLRSVWWREVILDGVEPEDVIDAWRSEKTALSGKRWRAPKKEYSRTYKDMGD